MKTYIIYHKVTADKNCPDGLAAAWVASKVYPDADIIGWQYQTPPPDFLEPGDRIIIVDFSFSASILNAWTEQGIEVILIDHHDGMLNELSQLADRILYRFDIKECGATLTWKHFFPEKPIPEFLKYIRDRDLFDHLLPNTREIHAAMSEMGRSFELFDRIENYSSEELIAEFVPIGAPLVGPRWEKCRAAAKRWQIAKIGGYFVPAVEMTEDESYLRSDICFVLYREMFAGGDGIAQSKTLPPEVIEGMYRRGELQPPFVAAYYKNRYDLRSDKHTYKSINVDTVAKKYGGGGSRNAAGFTKTEQY